VLTYSLYLSDPVLDRMSLGDKMSRRKLGIVADRLEEIGSPLAPFARQLAEVPGKEARREGCRKLREAIVSLHGR
jgi:hypothetical protein